MGPKNGSVKYNIRTNILGSENPATLQTLVELASVIGKEGDFVKATQLLQEARDIAEKKYGVNHFDTATILGHLADLSLRQDDLDGAEQLYKRVFEVFERLGPDEPHMATALNNYSNLLRRRGDFEGARRCRERALAAYEKIFGPNHPHTATSVANLGHLFYAEGDFVRALEFYQRALTAREKMLGTQHPDTRRSAHNVSDVLAKLDRSREADALRTRYELDS